MSPEPTVFIVDDDSNFSKSLVWLVESVGLRAECYRSAREFLGAYDPSRPGCLVLDMRMPEMGGLDLLDEFSARDIHIPVIVVTAYGDVPTAVRAMKSGAVDFLEKPFSHEILLSRIQQCLEEDQQRRRKQAVSAEIEQRLSLLTPRQREVMDLVVAGKSSKEIALQFCISPKTVENHRIKLMKKMQVSNVVRLIAVVASLSQSEGNPLPL